MAFASVGSFGTANSIASGTTLALTPTVTLEVGNLAMLNIAADKIATGTNPVAEFAHLAANVTSVTDTGSNVWYKLGEATGNLGGGAGAQAAAFYSIITTQLTTGSTVTVTFGAAITAKSCSGWEFTMGGSQLAVERIRFRAGVQIDPSAITLDDLPSREYLIWRAQATEANSSAWTPTTNFTNITNALASTGVGNTSMSTDGEFLIATTTSETSDPTKVTQDNIGFAVALWEGAQSSSPPWPVTGGVTQALTTAVTVPWPLGHVTDDICLIVCEYTGGETLSLTTANGFVAMASSPQQGTGTELAIYWCRATSGSMASPVFADPGNHTVAHAYLIRGCIATGNPWDVTAGDTATTSTSVTIPSVTTSVANCLILWMCAQEVDVSTDMFSAWANTGSTRFEELDSFSSTIGTGGGYGIAYGLRATAGASGTATATLASTSTQARITMAFKPPAAAAVTPPPYPTIVNFAVTRASSY